MIGIQRARNKQTQDSAFGQTGAVAYASQGAYYNESTSQTGSDDSITDFNDDEVLGFALDLDSSTKTIKFYNNNTLVQTVNLSSNFDNEDIVPLYVSNNGQVAMFKFGADSRFAGLKTAQNFRDTSGRGKVLYQPPAGYKALAVQNLEDTPISPIFGIKPEDHFNVVTYTGNGANSHSITGVGFQPDWVWIKRRDGAGSHYLVDSSRGLGTGDSFKVLLTEGTDTEYTGENDQLRTLNSDGFTLDDNSDTDFYVNRNTDTYVAWCWKANGGTTTTNDASSTGIGTIDSVYQANTIAGFSIVTYTGTGSNGTIAHGLGAVPKMMIAKRRDSTSHWVVYHQDLTDASYWLALNLNNAQDVEATHWNSTAPTSTLINLGSNTNTNGSSATYVIYAFTDVEGYSKFGSFVGNNLLDGPFIYTGFKPAWIMAKRSDSTSDWFLLDNKRSPENVVGGGGVGQLAANQNYAESSLSTYAIVDFLSNGFKMRCWMTYGSGIASGGT